MSEKFLNNDQQAKSWHTRTTDNLQWENICTNYQVGMDRLTGTWVNKLKIAIDTGVFMKDVQECADALYGGDVGECIRKFRKNLNDRKHRQKSGATRADVERLQLLFEFTDTLMPKRTVTDLPAGVKSQAKWMMTIEEIDLIDKDDYKALDGVYQCMQSKKSDYAQQIDDSIGMDEFQRRLDYVSSLRSAAKKKMNAPKPVVNADIMEKLKTGKALTPEEFLEFTKSLNLK